MSDKNITEVTNENEEKEVKLPKPICLITKANQKIVQTCTSMKSYRKDYYTPAGVLYRTKFVTAPFNRDGGRYDNVSRYFAYLKAKYGYMDA